MYRITVKTRSSGPLPADEREGVALGNRRTRQMSAEVSYNVPACNLAVELAQEVVDAESRHDVIESILVEFDDGF